MTCSSDSARVPGQVDRQEMTSGVATSICLEARLWAYGEANYQVTMS